jgi:hypothetical protein
MAGLVVCGVMGTMGIGARTGPSPLGQMVGALAGQATAGQMQMPDCF